MAAQSLPDHLAICLPPTERQRIDDALAATPLQREHAIDRMWEMCTSGARALRTQLALWLLSGEIELPKQLDQMCHAIPLLAKGGHAQALQTIVDHVPNPTAESLQSGVKWSIRNNHLAALQVCATAVCQDLDRHSIRFRRRVVALVRDHHSIEYTLAIEPIVTSDPRQMSQYVSSPVAIAYYHAQHLVWPDRFCSLLMQATAGTEQVDRDRLTAVWEICQSPGSTPWDQIPYDRCRTHAPLSIAMDAAVKIIEYEHDPCAEVILRLGNLLAVIPELAHYQAERICRTLIKTKYVVRERALQWFLATFGLDPDLEPGAIGIFTDHIYPETKAIMSAYFQQADNMSPISYRGQTVWYYFGELGAMVICRERLPHNFWYAHQIGEIYVYLQAIYYRDGAFYSFVGVPISLSDGPTVDVRRLNHPPSLLREEEDAVQTRLPKQLVDQWGHLFRPQAKSARSAIAHM